MLEKIPFLILSVVFGVIAILDKETISNITQGMMIEYSLLDAFFLVCYSVVFYLYKLFAPFSLCAIYVYHKVNGYLPLIYYFSPAILAIIVFGLIRFARRSRYGMFGAGSVRDHHCPEHTRIIPSRLFIVTERYAYFPYIGLFFVFAMFFLRTGAEKVRNKKLLQRGLGLLLGIYAIAFAYTIYDRNKAWKSNYFHDRCAE